MGYTTDFVGHIDITPPLNDDEINYLTAFAESRRCDRPGGPYDVPGNPAAERNLLVDRTIKRDGARATGSVVPVGAVLGRLLSGLQRLREVLRRDPLAALPHRALPRAQRSWPRGRVIPMFANFGFDHRLDGMVVGCRRDNKELYAIRVIGNEVVEEILRPADQRYVERPPLPTRSRSTARSLTEIDVAGSPDPVRSCRTS